MEILLRCKDNAYPCVVTIDEDNGRYMIRKSDSSGEVFNFPDELVAWILANWGPQDFVYEEDFHAMVKEIQDYMTVNH